MPRTPAARRFQLLPSARPAAHLLTLYNSPAMSMYRLMVVFWYRKQEPCWPHWSCHSRHALSITQPKAMGPGMPPVERGPLRTPTCPGSQKGDLGHWCSQGAAKGASVFLLWGPSCRPGLLCDPRPPGSFCVSEKTPSGQKVTWVPLAEH